MDSLMNAGKQFLSQQQGGGNNNNGGDQQQGGSGGGGGGFDFSSLIQHANNDDSNNSGGNDLFGQAAKYLQNSGAHQDGNVDENELLQAGQKVMGGGEAHSNEIGSAAALGAIKSFIGGGGSGGGSSGGSLQDKIVGAAMSQAAQLFDQKQANGEVSGGGKQDAVNKAGEMAMKLMVKHQVSGMLGGGGGGGLSSLAGMLM